MKSAALLALVLVSGALAAENGLPDFLPPATKAMFGLQVRRILNSSLRPVIDLDAATGALSVTAPIGGDWQRIVSLAGCDPFKDIEEVLIASSNEGRNPPMLLIARGSFNMARFAANATPYHSVLVLRTDKASIRTMALLDDSTAILGEIAEVHAAIDRRGTGKLIDPEIAAAAGSMRSRYDLWGFGDPVPPGSQSDGLNSAERFQFGISLTHGAKLPESVHFLELLAKSRPAADWAKFEIHEDHGILELAQSISEVQLKNALVAAGRSAALREPAETGVNIATPIPGTAPQAKPATDGIFTLPERQP